MTIGVLNKREAYLFDVWGVDSQKLDNIKFLKNMLITVIKKSNATFVKIVKKKFEPIGCTLLALLEESHLSIHTYPPQQFASLDFYTCGDAEPERGFSYIVAQLNPQRYSKKRLTRGEEI